MYLSGYVVSYKICTLYDKLIEYVYSEMAHSYEFDCCLKEIEKLIKIEEQEYNKLGLDEVNYFIDSLASRENFNNTDERYSNKLFERKRNLMDTKEDNSNDMLNTINSKLLIDFLKRTNYFILNEVANQYEDEEFVAELLLLHKASVIELLSSNSLLENLALSHGFIIEIIPTISFGMIDDYYHKDTKKEIQMALLDMTIMKIDELLEIDDYEDNSPEKVYYMIYNFCSIDVLLEILNKEMFEEVNKYFNKVLGNAKSNLSKGYLKKLIMKRKEEFT